MLRLVHSLAGQTNQIKSRTDVGSLEHWTDCLRFLISFDIIFREKNIFNFILIFTMQHLGWTLDWLSQIGYFLWRQVLRKQCVWLHLLLYMETVRLNIWLIVSESWVYLTSCLNKQTGLTSSSIELYISSLEYWSVCGSLFEDIWLKVLRQYGHIRLDSAPLKHILT